MRYGPDHSVAGVSNTKFRALGLVVLCLVLLVVLLTCVGCGKEKPPQEISLEAKSPEAKAPEEKLPYKEDVSPPDLSACTRLEIRYPRSTLDYFLGDTAIQRSLFSIEERNWIQSIEFFTVTDPNIIASFAHDVSLGRYKANLRGRSLMAGTPVAVDCYRDNDHIISFTAYEYLIITKDDRVFEYPMFKYPTYMPSLKLIEPAEIQPFKLRFECGLNMGRIYTSGPLSHKEVSSYPQPTEWCDAVLRDRRNKNYVSEEKMRVSFKCPALVEGKCHYALNPFCEPNSPPDTVLLFETKSGWNQHGGPELFTFDNHDPKGGCVLFNDGTVKFIRTTEKLQQLRWK